MNETDLNTSIQELLDGVISEANLELLQDELASSELARELYLDSAEVHSLLTQKGQIRAKISDNIVPMDRIIRRQKFKALKTVALTTAAILLVGILVMQFFSLNPAEDALTFRVSQGTLYSITHTSDKDAPEGLVLEKGSRLKVEQGAVELTLASGVKSVILAPADIVVLRDETLKLDQGTAWFQVPEGAEGFTVHTKELLVVDLGTEFGVVADSDNYDEVHVFKGRVSLTSKRDLKGSAILSAGEARRINSFGRFTDVKKKDSLFLTSLPKGLPYMHWSFDEIKDDGFAVQGLHPSLSNGHAKPQAVLPASMSINGKHGKALRFTGKRGQEVMTSWKGISGSRPRTIMCWVRIGKDGNVGNFAGIVGWGARMEGPHKFKFLAIPGKTQGQAFLRFSGFSGSKGYDGTTNLADGKWHHVACVYSETSNNAQMYVDGRLEKITSNSHADKIMLNTMTDMSDSIPVSFGTDIHHDEVKNMRDIFIGDIDEVFIFEGALKEQTINTIMRTNHYTP